MVKYIKIPKFKNTTGSISVIEKLFRFKIKRVYFIYDIKGDRGGHRHIKTRQFLLCLKGKCEIVIIKNKKKKKITLSDNNKGILLEPDDWHKIINSNKDTIIVVLASEYYNEQDYINHST